MKEFHVNSEMGHGMGHFSYQLCRILQREILWDGHFSHPMRFWPKMGGIHPILHLVGWDVPNGTIFDPDKTAP